MSLEQPENKKTVQSRGQSRAYSELSFKLGSTLSYELAYFELKVLVAERVPWKAEKKKTVERRSTK